MSAGLWFIIAIIGFSLAGVLFITAIFMFIKMNIPAIIGDLTGRTAAKQIEKMRQLNAETGDKSHRPDAFNLKRGSLTEPVDSMKSGRLKKSGSTAKTVIAHPSKRLDVKGDTGFTTTQSSNDSLPTDVLAEKTDILMKDEVTAILSDATTVLDDTVHDNATTVLAPTGELTEADSPLSQRIEFKVVKSVLAIHTDEVIG